MAVMSPATRALLRRDIGALGPQVAAGVCHSRQRNASTTWSVWCQFCSDLHLDPGLSSVRDPVPYLLLFANRWRDGRLAPKGQPVRARSVEDAIRHVGQAFAFLGETDPRLNIHGKIDRRISRIIRGWKKSDPHPTRKQPVP